MATEEKCAKLKKEFVDAMNEWVTASNRASRWVATEPLDPLKDVEPLPFEEVKADYDREAEARARFLEVNQKYSECLQREGENPSGRSKTGVKIDEYDPEKAYRSGKTTPGKFGPSIGEYDAEEQARSDDVPPKFGPSVGDYEPE